MKRPPIDHVVPALPAERTLRMWRTIEAAQRRRRTPRWLLAAAAALALGLAWRVSLDAPLASGDVVTTERRPTAMHLPDGSELTASEATELHVLHAEEREVTLRLDRGRVACDVSHRERRRFAVHAGGITVLVKGTRFTVEALETGTRVQVERGVVEVHGAHDALLATLRAGQSWAQGTDAVPAVAEVAARDTVDVEPAAEAAPPVVEPAAVEPAPRRARAPRVHPVNEAEQLLERANDARLSGDTRAAADLYDDLRTRFPRDARAGLAAFELARISLHALRDPVRARDALEFARAHGQGFARDDADALAVDAASQLNDPACEEARDAFLRQHPHSAHRARVERACPGR